MARIKIGNVFPPLAWLMERCAPAGFGLGGYCNPIDHWDNAIACGWYSSANGSPTAATESTIWAGEVTADPSTGQITQRVRSQGQYSQSEAVRHFFDNAWTSWEWVNPPMVAGTEYRTTERWQYKPVYTALVDCGACVSPSKEIATELTCKSIIRHCGTVGGHNLPTINATLDNAWSVWAMAMNSDGRVKITVYSGTGMTTERAYVQVWYTKD